MNAKKNIIASLIIRGFGIASSFILVPLTIQYIDKNNYGIWLTISSLVAWMNYFDIGLNNGLRNKYAESKALGRIDLAQQYVSTTYALLIMIFIPIIICFAIVNNFIDWSIILKSPDSIPEELGKVILIVFSYFCLKFILSTINTILISDQKPAIASFISLLEQLLALLIIFILTLYTKGSLLNLCLGLCIAPLILFLFVNIILFSRRYKNVSPKFSEVKFSLAKDLLKLGVNFFLLQIAVLVQFQTSNIIIIRSFGAEQVTAYNIAFKYFSILSVIFIIIIAPFWSAVTDSWSKNDLEWIKNGVKKYQKLVAIFFVIGLLMVLVSPVFYDLWLGKGTVKITYTLSLLMFVYIYSTMIGKAQGLVLNGIGALKIQLYSSIVSPVLFLFLCYIMIHFLHLGLISVVISGTLTNFGGAILAPLQYRKIFINNKKGIWLK